MSKRGAEEYITKDHGSTPNELSDGSRVKMATAAQLAKRKMATPRSRAGRTGQSPLPGAPPSNPFTSTSLFGATQNNQQAPFQNAGAVTFGASQSFPPGDSSSNGGFKFSVPGQTSSFTFGQSTPNNPFANLNGSAQNQPTTTQDSNDTIMESPQKKPAFGAGVFGSGNNGDAKQSTGFVFGQQPSQPSGQPVFGFSQAQNSTGSTGPSLFGQSDSKKTEASTTPSLFGQSTQAQTNATPAFGGFGQNSSQPTTTPSSSFNFSQSITSAPSAAPAFSFGQSTTSAPSSAPAFSFGQSTTAPVTNGSLFGETGKSSPPMFGTSAPAAQSVSSAPLFGSAPVKSADNIFAGFGSSKPTEAASTPAVVSKPEPSKTLFGQSATAVSQDDSRLSSAASDQSQSNPFAGLFAKSTQNQPSSITSTTAEAPKPLFNLGTPGQPPALSSGQTPSSENSSSGPPGSTPKKPLFSFGTSTVTSGPSLFPPAKPTTEAPVNTNSYTGMSAKNSDSTGKKTDQSPFNFGAKTPAAMPSKEDSSASKLFGGFGSSQTTAPATTSQRPLEAQTPANQASSAPLFGSSVSAKHVETAKSAPDLFAKSSKSSAPIINSTSLSAKPGDVAEAPQRSVNTHPPTRIPPYLNGDDYKAYDSNYRLHSLNREFQKRIASLDPSHEDFENIVRNYVAARESIGESIGLYMRNTAGMKRKADDDDNRHDEESTSAKRSKPAEQALTKHPAGGGSMSSSVFQPVPLSASRPSATFANTPTVKSTPSSAATTSSLFSSMIPESKIASITSSNPFANLSKTTTSSSVDTSPKQPAFSFANQASTLTSVESTTPTKSPPKKLNFEPPKFAPPAAGNFMNAFKQQSEVNAVKFAKEAKAKRKAEEFDSDEDDEEEWNKKYEEEEKAKKVKLGAVEQTGFKPVLSSSSAPSKPRFGFGGSTSTPSASSKSAAGFVSGKFGAENSPGKSVDISDNDTSAEDDDDDEAEETGDADGEDADGEEDEEAEDDLPEDEVNDEDENDDEDFETHMANSRSQGKSLFDRVTPNPSSQKELSSASNPIASIEKDPLKKSALFGGSSNKSTPEAPAFSPLTPASTKEPYVPAKTFNFTPTPAVANSTPAFGASIFAGGAMKDGPLTGEGLFGSRPSTPSNADKPKPNTFSGFGTPSNAGPSDHTWKKGSEIKFGSESTEAPAVSITEPSPSKPFGNLFGANTNGANTSAGPGLGFSFGQSPVPGFLSAASYLAGGSGTTSGLSSRATSPGTTDNESVATNEEDFSNDTQVSLLESRPGEENEDMLFEARAKAMRFYTEDQIKGTKFSKGWNSAGLGPARLLKHKETGKTRIVMRAEPGANVILNANLQPTFNYGYAPAGSAGTVKFNVLSKDGLQGWTLKMKTQQQGEDLAKLMEENKAPSS